MKKKIDNHGEIELKNKLAIHRFMRCNKYIHRKDDCLWEKLWDVLGGCTITNPPIQFDGGHKDD